MDPDLALATLVSEFPRQSVDDLQSILLASAGNINTARTSARRQARQHQVASLGDWLKPGKQDAGKRPSPVVRAQMDEPPMTNSPPAKRRKQDHDMLLNRKSINQVLKYDTTSSVPAALPPLTLETPEAIAAHLPCTLQLNVLPAELASDLFLEMMEESETWTKNSWYMVILVAALRDISPLTGSQVDRQVESPHMTSFYGDETVLEAAATHWYVGRRTAPPRKFTTLMLETREIVEARVREALQSRKRDMLEYASPWRANVSAANRYYDSVVPTASEGKAPSYLGPSPTIASISLGCQRVFRLRGGSPARTYNCPLPHNSLLLMHGGCQERFKHSIPPATALDAYRPITDSKKRSFGDRINLTYRFYRPDFGSPPVCRCGVPCLLRSDLKHNAGQEERWRYYWQCQAGTQNAGKGCSHWVALNMQAEGKGPCLGDAMM